MEDSIKQHLNKYDLDLRKSHYSRFMDQKVTPDVLAFICDCIRNFTSDKTDKTFTSTDIQTSDYFEKSVRFIFGKPSPLNEKTAREYDKFVNQPLRMLAYAKILNSSQAGKGYIYTINDRELLKWISYNPKNALQFIYIYIKKVLTDSGEYEQYEKLRELYNNHLLTNDEFQKVKKRFQQFMMGNTEINQIVEVNRIFPKIFNPFAVTNVLPGSKSGKLTDYPFYYQDLMYNDTNFRDVKKNKGVTRQEAEEENSIQTELVNLDYRIYKAKALINRLYNDSELKDRWSHGSATQVHHIFPVNEYKEFADYVENLIKLTPTQHNTKAHPNNRTQEIDKSYQLECLIAKCVSIENSLLKGEKIYEKSKFIKILTEGLHLNLSEDITFDELKQNLRKIEYQI